ncbi:MAG: response regulator [Tannerellaceae bacterium]|jgi:ligand-binding sensor domain-containing protein/DNA-binding response OmpR family regulator/nitrogen-specific signal transduction histidine kinase|nr:response regulator [Tannerellaceae bacterium]
MRNWIVCLVCLLVSLAASGEERFYFQHFMVENGLPQNTVNCIFQDNDGFMWFGTKDGLSRYDGYSFLNFRHDKEDEGSIGNNFVRCIFQREKEEIWVGTDAGVYIYHPATEQFSHFGLRTAEGISIEKEVNNIQVGADGNIWFAVDWQGVFCYNPREEELVLYKVNTIVNAWCIWIDHENTVWVGTNGGGLNRYNRRSDRFETISKGKDIGDDINCLFQDNYNDLIIGTAAGVKKLSLSAGQISPLIQPADENQLFVREIIRKSDQELYFGTESGVYIYHTQNRSIQRLHHDPSDPYSLSDNAVYSMYKDREGGLWIGTYFGGINYYPPQHTPFARFYPKKSPQSIQGKRVREFKEDLNGGIWIGTEDAGLTYYHPASETYRNFLPDGKAGSISYHNIHGLLADGDKLWIGTFKHGLDVMDIRTQKVVRHYSKTDDPHSICDNSIFSIFKDAAGYLWFGTIYGLSIYDPEQDHFTKIAYVGDTFIYDIYQSYDGILWFASFNRGVFRYNPLKNEWKNFMHEPDNPKSLAYDKIISVFEDSKKNIWFSSEGGGICRFNREDDSFTSFTSKDGLPNDVIYKIVEDNKGCFWLTSNHGLSCFHPGNGYVKTFTLANGLLGDQFNYKSGYKTSDGRLYFGCLNGFISFDPAMFTENEYIPPVVITDFRLFNKQPKDSLLKKSIYHAKEVHLKHNQSSFSIDFAALSYAAPGKNQYEYRLEGLENEWTALEGKHSVSFSNIPPGHYVFRLKGSNNDGKWEKTPTSLAIHIHPPFYKSHWAYVIYILVFLCLACMLIISSVKKMEKKHREKLQWFENEKNKEIYNAKIMFFTNIAHEIRTPLSLIKGPVEYILTNRPDKEELKENLQVIEKNTQRLLDLSNQLLDFRKMETNGFQLNYMHSDLKQLIKDVYMRFELSARQKKIAFDLALPPDKLFADIDREALTKIISNLFSNAIKYAASQIILSLENDEKTFRLTVSSDGFLIPEDMKEKIFEPFFQVGDENGNSIKSGAGLGLALARSLAELHKGSLYLEDFSGPLNIFVLTLPLVQTSRISMAEEEDEQEIEASQKDEGLFHNKPTVLIVEDDTDMRAFLHKRLKQSYQVIKASDGKKAMEYLKKEQIDIVVTDIIMPEMDGLQLCAEIKSNVDSSHIPVIMLTAKADIKSRIEGLDAGADAYVEKPFSIEHLLAQISNIFSNRNKIKQAFINSPAQNIASIALTKADELFLEKLMQIIQKNLSDVSFNVVQLAGELCMSRSSLHRKIKGVSELTPNDFIQLVRLKKAAELLQEGSYRINEICYLVGFNSSSYFSKSFKKQFGISPKELKGKN